MPGLGEPGQLIDSAFHRAPRLDVRIEEVAADEDGVDRAREALVDGPAEGGQLSLALADGGRSEVRVPRPQVDVGQVQQQRHAWRVPPSPARQGAACGPPYCAIGVPPRTRPHRPPA